MKNSYPNLTKNCTLGISEDINGDFYTIYDVDKIVDNFLVCVDIWKSNDESLNIDNLKFLLKEFGNV